MANVRAKHIHAHMHDPDVMKPILKAASSILSYSFGISGKQASLAVLRKKLDPAYAVMAKVLTQLLDKPVQADQLSRLSIEVAAADGTAKVFVVFRDREKRAEQQFNVFFVNFDQMTFMKRHIEKGKQTPEARIARSIEFYFAV